MTERQREAASNLEPLVALGREWVRTSANVPSEAVEFLGRPIRQRRTPAQGAAAGTLVVPEGAPEPVIRIMSYGGDQLEERTLRSVEELRDVLESFGSRTTWIDVVGFGNGAVLTDLGRELGIHPLAMADVVNVPQRPKAELHEGRLLVITQMARIADSGEVDVEQVSLVLGSNWVVSFQERAGDVFDSARDRLRSASSRIRRKGPDHLLYNLVDSVIDGFFPVVEALGGVVDALEDEVIQRAGRASLARIHATRRTLLHLHRVQWRQRDAVATMLRDEDLPLSAGVKPYLRDAHDHALQTLDVLENYREMMVGLMDLQMSNESHRATEVMKILTIVSTIFIPLTFVAGVYGMNFVYMPELHWRWAYPAVWGLMVGLGIGLVSWFRWRGWIGSPARD